MMKLKKRAQTCSMRYKINGYIYSAQFILIQHEVEQVQATPTPPPPPIETVESAACTEDPDYDQ